MARSNNFMKQLWAVKSTVICLLTPVCFLPFVLIFDSKEWRCVYVMSVMAVYWVGDALPWAVTSLLPLLLFPLTGLMTASALASHYVQDTSMFVVGGLMVAVSVEKCRLDRRLALWILMKTGCSPRGLMLVFMIPTWLLSLWLGSTSATVVMMPALTAVLNQLKDTKVKRSPSLLASKTVQRAVSNKPAATAGQWKSLLSPRKHTKRPEDRETKDDDQARSRAVGEELDTKLSPATSRATYERMCKGMSLCLAYSANAGATGWLTSDPANLIMQKQAQGLRAERSVDSGVTFSSWMVFALPASFLSLLLAFLFLSCFFLGLREWRKKTRGEKVKNALVKETILRQYQKLGPLSFAEKVVTGHIAVFLCLLLTMDLPMVPGWRSLFPPHYVGSTTVAMLMCFSLFLFPAQRPQSFCWKYEHTRGTNVPAILDWGAMQTRFPWGVLLLLGAGYALATVCEESGIPQWVGTQLEGLEHLAPWHLSLLLPVVMSLLAEITATVSTATHLMPVVARLAMDMEVSPLYFLFPCAMAMSLTFMLPIATASNTIVFAAGHLKVKDMVMAGCVLNVLCVLVVSLAANTWAMAYFHFSTLPPDFRTTALNTTLSTWFDLSAGTLMENVTVPGAATVSSGAETLSDFITVNGTASALNMTTIL